jgi:hypothetical protein
MQGGGQQGGGQQRARPAGRRRHEAHSHFGTREFGTRSTYSRGSVRVDRDRPPRPLSSSNALPPAGSGAHRPAASAERGSRRRRARARRGAPGPPPGAGVTTEAHTAPRRWPPSPSPAPLPHPPDRRLRQDRPLHGARTTKSEHLTRALPPARQQFRPAAGFSVLVAPAPDPHTLALRGALSTRHAPGPAPLRRRSAWTSSPNGPHLETRGPVSARAARVRVDEEVWRTSVVPSAAGRSRSVLAGTCLKVAGCFAAGRRAGARRSRLVQALGTTRLASCVTAAHLERVLDRPPP